MELSIIIPARREIFLTRTIQDILENIEADTEVIAVLDGEWVLPPIPQHPRVNVIYVPKSIGQRAATNLGVKLSKAKYVMKVDAHCSFDKGFDRKMIEQMKDDWTLIPVMRNLHAFDYKCYKCGWTQYQGPRPKCPTCGDNGKVRMKMVWIGKKRPQSTSYCFDSQPHFQYFEAYKHREPYLTDIKTGLTESMSIQGSCFMTTREKYNELNLSDEDYGSWGNQGIEVACKTWLSGGKVMINHNTWYAHMFRTQPGFKFPWEIHEKDVQETKKKVWDDIIGYKLSNQIHPVSWLIEKFAPISGWSEEQLKQLKKG